MNLGGLAAHLGSVHPFDATDWALRRVACPVCGASKGGHVQRERLFHGEALKLDCSEMCGWSAYARLLPPGAAAPEGGRNWVEFDPITRARVEARQVMTNSRQEQFGPKEVPGFEDKKARGRRKCLVAGCGAVCVEAGLCDVHHTLWRVARTETAVSSQAWAEGHVMRGKPREATDAPEIKPAKPVDAPKAPEAPEATAETPEQNPGVHPACEGASTMHEVINQRRRLAASDGEGESASVEQPTAETPGKESVVADENVKRCAVHESMPASKKNDRLCQYCCRARGKNKDESEDEFIARRRLTVAAGAAGAARSSLHREKQRQESTAHAQRAGAAPGEARGLVESPGVEPHGTTAPGFNGRLRRVALSRPTVELTFVAYGDRVCVFDDAGEPIVQVALDAPRGAGVAA